MQSKLFNRYVWLVNTISGRGQISLEDIHRCWAKSVVNEDHESVYPKRTFIRHKADIAEIFGIEIGYNRATNCYYIANQENVEKGELRQWLLNNFALNNALTESKLLHRRIQVEQIPAGTHYLPMIISAMRNNHAVSMTHNRFGKEAHQITLEPYCLKVFKQRWYVYGRPSDHPDERRIYALDRISSIEETDEEFRLPKKFDAEREFASYYGVFTNCKAEVVRARVVSKGAFFLRTLPLHPSQHEEVSTAEYSEFRWTIAPTYDFIQQLMTFGEELEILEPQWLREEIRQKAEKMLAIYQPSV